MNIIVVKYLAAAGGGALVSGLGTFLVTRKIISKRWQGYADEQIESVKENYRIIRGEGKYDDPENLLVQSDIENGYGEQHRGEDFDEDYPRDEEEIGELAEKIHGLGYAAAQNIIGLAEDEGVTLESAVDIHVERVEKVRKPPKPKAIVKRNESIYDKVVKEAPDGTPRDTSKPYIISLEEWTMPDDEYAHHETPQMKYFAGDKTLLDSAEGIILNPDELVGLANLERFGYLSEDEDFVYIRNEALDLSFEVVRIEVGYAESRGLNVDPGEEDTYKKKRRRVEQED